MNKNIFDEKYVNAEKHIERERKRGFDDNVLRCFLIGYITGSANTSYEEVYTVSQLDKLFDLVG